MKHYVTDWNICDTMMKAAGNRAVNKQTRGLAAIGPDSYAADDETKACNK
jgi:hypothetical protein